MGSAHMTVLPLCTPLFDLFPQDSIPHIDVHCLLDTLAYMFRYLLVPSLFLPVSDGLENWTGEEEMDREDLLQMTGTYLLHTIQQCNPKVCHHMGNGAQVCSGG